MDLIASGEVGNAPLILTALWLDARTPGCARGGLTPGLPACRGPATCGAGA
jgi:hypothetical protein